MKVKALLKSNKPEEARQAIHFALAVVEIPAFRASENRSRQCPQSPARRSGFRNSLRHPENVAVLNNLAQSRSWRDRKRADLQRSLVLEQSNPETGCPGIDRVRGNPDQARAFSRQLSSSWLMEAYLEMGSPTRTVKTTPFRLTSKAIAMVSNIPAIPAGCCSYRKAAYRNAGVRQAQLSPSDQNICRQLAAVVAQYR